MKISNVADLLVETLLAVGVERVYGVVGDSLNAVTEAMRAREAPRWVHMRNEEAGAFAAGAEAQLTGRLAVCAGSCGPGNLHLINGLFDCHRSGAPVLAIAAHIPSPEIGSGYFQETHPQNLFRECSHYCELVSTPEQLPFVLETAIRTAVGRSGVSVIVLPGDVALKPAPVTSVSAAAGLLPAPPQARPRVEEIEALANLLNGAKKVTLLCGRGTKDAHKEVVELAATLKAPIVHTLRGKEFVEHDNPYDVGMTGLIGFSSGYLAMKECDALLMLGADFPYRQFYPEKAKVAQIDVRPEHLGRRRRLDLAVVADVKSALQALAPRLSRREDSAHLDACLAHYKKAREGLDDLATGEPGKTPIHPQFVAKTLSDVASLDAVFSCDVGTPTVWAARYLKMNGRRRLLGSFVHGSMANAMPQAIGAQAAYPGQQVISMSGDGGFAMLMGDVLTLRQEKLPVKLVIFNNGTLGFVELEMKSAGFIETGVALDNPDFAAMARAIGVHGERVEDPGELEGALRRALAHDGPALVDVVVARQELVLPPKIAAEQVKGFGLYVLKAVMSGRGDELVDLARANLLR